MISFGSWIAVNSLFKRILNIYFTLVKDLNFLKFHIFEYEETKYKAIHFFQ